MMANLPHTLLVALIGLSVSSDAFAGLFRAYLSAKGSDANPCTVSQPCRLLPAALAAVDDGGEVWIVDSANYNVSTVNIDKSVSILAIPGAIASVVATGGLSALKISTPGTIITLRNFVIRALGSGAFGIYFTQGATLNVEDCEVAGMDFDGIRAEAGMVTIRNTVLRDNIQAGFSGAGPTTAVLDGVRSIGNGYGVLASSNGARITVNNSVLSNNGAVGAWSFAYEGGFSTLTVARSAVTGNPTALKVGALAGGNASLVSDTNVIMFVSDTAFAFTGGPGLEAIFTRQNNTVGYIAQDITPGHSLVPLAVY